MSYRTLIAELDALSRTRTLTLAESLQLERAIRDDRRYGGPRPRQPDWRPDEDKKAAALRRQGASYAAIADQVGRSKDAVAARLRYIRFTLGGVSSI